MAGLVPAIHAFSLILKGKHGVDARDKRGHDALSRGRNPRLGRE
jgi:hypothetical protein